MQRCKRARNEDPRDQDFLPTNHQYRGFVLSPRQGVEKVRYSDLSPGAFFDGFVAPRKPVLMDGCLSEKEGWRGNKWTNQYLREKAGDADVKVEYRDGAEERFGQGLEKGMKFGDFLGELERKNDLLYLTTQELGVDPSGRPSLMSAPLDRLRGDFPLRPRLAGALVPQNVNLWMGHSKKGGSSSGLHHDFHDNLYVLLRGKKRFRLFSPADAHRMYLEGEVVKVHPNGRINYKGKETLADGSDPLAKSAASAADLVDRAAMKVEKIAADAMLRAAAAPDDPGPGAGATEQSAERDRLAVGSRKLEEVAAAQTALERGESGAAGRLEAAEEELERALEAVLDAECAGGGGFGEAESGDSSSDSDGGPGFFDGIDDDPSEEAFLAASTKKAKGTRAFVSDGDLRAASGVDGDDTSSDGFSGRDGGVGSDGVDHDVLDTAASTARRVSSSGVHLGAACAAAATAPGSTRRGIAGPSGTNGSSSRNADGFPAEANTKSENGIGVLAAEQSRKAKGKGREEVPEGEQEEKQEGLEKKSKSTPSNFSRVDPSLSRSELAERFPLFLKAGSCTVEVKAGQMLYLPAGWFHEVLSVASEDGHMAFNYWFHPPDSFSSASSPYESNFWQKDWEGRKEEGEHAAKGFS